MTNVHQIDPHVTRIIVAARSVAKEAQRRVRRGVQENLTEPQRKLIDAIAAYDRVLQIGDRSSA